MATAVKRARKPKRVGKNELIEMLGGEGAPRAMHLDVVGTAEAAQILKVERARIGKWRRKKILLSNGERVDFPEPITMATTAALIEGTDTPDHSKLAATPLWWADDVRDLAKVLAKNKPRD